ncbi:hypothetical protein WN943_029602 [Citrus x changshan-huyou]
MGDMVPQMYFKISHPLDPDTPNPEELPEVAQIPASTSIVDPHCGSSRSNERPSSPK